MPGCGWLVISLSLLHGRRLAQGGLHHGSVLQDVCCAQPGLRFKAAQTLEQSLQAWDMVTPGGPLSKENQSNAASEGGGHMQILAVQQDHAGDQAAQIKLPAVHLIWLLALGLCQALAAPQGPVMERLAEQLSRGQSQTSLPSLAKALQYSIGCILPHRPAIRPL